MAFSSGIAQQQMNLLYDPSAKSPKPKLTAVQESQIISESLSKGNAQLQTYCQNDFSHANVRFAAHGSFTRLKSNQTAYLIAPCPFGGITGSADNGVISIYESNKRIASYAVAARGDGLIRDFYSVNDINQNDLSEIALLSEYADGLCSSNTLDLAEFDHDILKPIGALHPNQQCAEELGSARTFDRSIFVSKGSSPVFVGYEMKKKPILTFLKFEKSVMQLMAIR